ncbi:hypothetical protein AB0J72_47735 [Dactylosporangium sp. NPDC049742]|uniref:hypothetical protein n=1 Tax=Dactylosporangium sp. NPDC049742 TaxID=3154737 RepID=UPI003444A912
MPASRAVGAPPTCRRAVLPPGRSGPQRLGRSPAVRPETTFKALRGVGWHRIDDHGVEVGTRHHQDTVSVEQPHGVPGLGRHADMSLLRDGKAGSYGSNLGTTNFIGFVSGPLNYGGKSPCP